MKFLLLFLSIYCLSANAIELQLIYDGTYWESPVSNIYKFKDGANTCYIYTSENISCVKDN